MPEAVATYVETKSFLEVEKVHQSIIQTYKEDFPKYASKSESVNLGHLMSTLPRHIGQRIKYSELLKDVRHPSIKAGKSGTLKSLFVFVATKKLKRAIRFDLKDRPPSGRQEEIETSLFDGYEKKKLSFTLMNDPLFLIPFLMDISPR